MGPNKVGMHQRAQSGSPGRLSLPLAAPFHAGTCEVRHRILSLEQSRLCWASRLAVDLLYCCVMSGAGHGSSLVEDGATEVLSW